MSLSNFLLEGGKAVKVSKPVSQADAKRLVSELKQLIASYLNVEPKLIGSAGKKPEGQDSGDIDFVVSLPELAKTVQGSKQAALVKLGDAVRQLGLAAHKHAPTDALNKYHYASPGAGIYSFAYPYFADNDRMRVKFVQVDVLPVNDTEWAEWAHHASEVDLARGLKAAHRNELMFAVAKHAQQDVKVKDAEGNPVEVDRHFYDPRLGLLRGKQSRMGNKGKPVKAFNTVGEKKVVTTNPDEAAKVMFGPRYKAKDLLSFDDVWGAMHDSRFPHKEHLKVIKQMAREGIVKKKLIVPMELEVDGSNEGILV